MSQPFCGFGSQDVQNSEQILSSAKMDHSNSMEFINDIDQSKIESGDLQVPNDTPENNNETTEIERNDVNGNDEKQTFVAEILDKMVSMAEVHNKLQIGDVSNDDAIDEEGCCIPMLKDDAETQLFLSFC